MINNNLYAYRYFYFLENETKSTWLDTLLHIQESAEFGLPEVLTLLEPAWYEELRIDINLFDPRGQTGFRPAPVGAKCDSMQFWGYECPFTNSKVHVDHFFPFSRGGSNHHSNATYLCEKHNTMKFTDIHIINWQHIIHNSEWIFLNFKNIFMHSKALAGLRLYTPDSQIRRL